MRSFVCLATVISLLLVTGCRDDGSPYSGKAPVETMAAPQPISSPTPPTSSCKTREAINPPEFGDVFVNADSNGFPDRMNIHASPTDTGYAYYLQLVVDSRSAISIEIAPAFLDTIILPIVRPIGGYDVNGDGRDELFAVTGNGASTTWIDVYEFDPETCALVRLAAPGDDPSSQFLVGMSIGGGAGLQCFDGQLVSYRSDRTSVEEPLSYSGKWAFYVIDGAQLRLVNETSIKPEVAGVDLGATFDCGLLGYKLTPVAQPSTDGIPTTPPETPTPPASAQPATPRVTPPAR